MTDLAKLVVRLEAQTAKYQKDLESANVKLGKFEKNTKKSISGIKTAFSALAIGAFAKKIIDATIAQERAVKQLEQGLATTGGAVGLSLQELTKHAENLQKATTFGDEDIIAAQSKLVTFTRITGDEFQRTTELALDLSTRMGTDVTSASIQLGKALNDPIKNLSALSRAGIQFTDNQKDVIKALFESGREADAQKVILAELETQFGGSARAARDTFGGALKSVGNSFGDLLEAKGGLKDAQAALEDFNDLLQDPDTIAAANSLGSGIIKIFSQIAGAISKAVNAASDFGESIAAAVNGPALDDLPRILGQIADIEEKRQSILSIPENRRRGPVKARLADLNAEKKALEGLLETRKLFGLSNDPEDPASLSGFDPASTFSSNKNEAKGATGVPTIDVENAEFERLKTSLLTQEEAIMQSYANRRDLVYENTITGSDQQYDLIEQLNAKEQEQLINHLASMGSTEAQWRKKQLEFDKATGIQKAKLLTGGLADLSAASAQHSKKMFNINKISAIAEATISLAQGIAAGVKLGWPLGIPAVAWAIGTGVPQIRAIKATTFQGGGGGTTPSSAASVPVINDIPVSSSARPAAAERTEPGQTFIFNIDQVSGNDAQKIAEQLKDYVKESDFVLIEATSRNGQELNA